MNNPGRRKMRILFLTNFYLVDGLGGEEQSGQQVVKGLYEFKLVGDQE
jgi:hypothetical protein